jgi:surface polysaccharide O-acyltransferase-like enzyme
VLFFLAIGMRRMNYTNRWLAYTSEAVLPFYTLHQVVIVTLGAALFRWELPILVKYLALAGGAFLIIMGMYELLIRRVNVLRFLFGMQPNPSPRIERSPGRG